MIVRLARWLSAVRISWYPGQPRSVTSTFRQGRNKSRAASFINWAERLARSGISCEVVDLRSLAPLDVATVAASAARTGALVTLEEGQLTCGVGAEVAFRVQDEVGAVRVARVGALPAPVSSNPVLEAAAVPDAERVIRAVRRMLDA